MFHLYFSMKYLIIFSESIVCSDNLKDTLCWSEFQVVVKLSCHDLLPGWMDSVFSLSKWITNTLLKILMKILDLFWGKSLVMTLMTFRRVGCKGEKVCFIFDESNVLESSFLERMNTLLASGEIPGEFSFKIRLVFRSIRRRWILSINAWMQRISSKKWIDHW